VEPFINASDSPFYVLLVGLAAGTWWIIRYVLKKNDEREKRFIAVIEMQAKGLQALDNLQSDVKAIKKWVTEQRREQG
jgi:hypothetical protein